jgi:predicted PurR-regulated permease PerM
MSKRAEEELPRWTASQVMWATIFVVAVGLGFLLLYQLRAVLFVLFVAVVIGTAIRPAVQWLHGKGLPRPAGVILIYLLLTGFVVGFVALVVPMVAEQVTQIALELPGYYAEGRQMLITSPSWVLRRLAYRFPAALQLEMTSPLPAEEGEPLNRVAQLFAYGSVAFRGLFVTLAVLVLAFYWTLESRRSLRHLMLWIPEKGREEVRETLTEIETRVGGYVRAQVILCFIIGFMALVAYLLIGLPYALVLAIIAGILEAVPMIGPVLGAVPAGLVALTISPTKAIWVGIATVIFQNVENYFLVPRVMNRTTGVNPMVTLLAVTAFTAILGLPGAILAIPVAATAQLLLNRFVLTPGDAESETAGGRDYLSVLRREAKTLSQDVRKRLQGKEEPPEEDADDVEDAIESVANELDRVLSALEEEE